MGDLLSFSSRLQERLQRKEVRRQTSDRSYNRAETIMKSTRQSRGARQTVTAATDVMFAWIGRRTVRTGPLRLLRAKSLAGAHPLAAEEVAGGHGTFAGGLEFKNLQSSVGGGDEEARGRLED
jgi:hypothetical protein